MKQSGTLLLILFLPLMEMLKCFLKNLIHLEAV